MSGAAPVLPKFQFVSSTGAPLANGTVTAYLAGTTTLTNTWQNSALSTLNTNPIQLDANGRCDIWLSSSLTYKFVLANAGGATQWTVDDISGALGEAGLLALLAADSGSDLVGFIQSGAGAVASTVQDELRETIHATRYGTLAEAVAAAPDGARIVCPAGYAHTVASTITINKALTISGPNWETVEITGPANAPIFEGSGTVTNFILEGITWTGGSGTSQLLKVPTGVSWFEGRTIVRGCKINNFGAFAIERGDSVYMTEIRGNRFDNCVGSIKEGWASDSVIVDNYFNEGMAGNPVIHTVGGARTIIKDNDFIRGSGTITEADILLDPTTSFGRGGRTYIHHNKFGGEGETSGRPKIQCYNATATNRSTDVSVAFNQLHGADNSVGGTSYAIQIDNAIALWDICHNEFDDYDLIVQDNFRNMAGENGGNRLSNNRHYWSTRLTGALFLHGGRQFTDVYAPEFGYTRPAVTYEPREARNRLWNSSTINSWNASVGVTITTGQADPDAGTSAFLVESDGAAAAQSVSRVIDTTGMGTDAVLKLRLRAQDSTKIVVGIRDTTNSVWVGEIQSLVLDAQWRDYQFSLHGINPASTLTLVMYPATPTVALAGGFYIYQPQVSDYDSDYIPTPTNAAVSDTTIGRRFHKKISIAGGAKATLPTYADNAAALAGGLLATDVYQTAAGAVRIVV